MGYSRAIRAQSSPETQHRALEWYCRDGSGEGHHQVTISTRGSTAPQSLR